MDVRATIGNALTRHGVNPEGPLKRYDESVNVFTDIASKPFSSQSEMETYMMSTYPDMFSKENIAEIWKSTRKPQKGGVAPLVAAAAMQIGPKIASGLATALARIFTFRMPEAKDFKDPNDFISPLVYAALDRIVGLFIPEVRNPMKMILSMFFILDYLQKLALWGPLLETALDITTAMMPAVGTMIQHTGAFIAGPIGGIAGWLLSINFFVITMMISISRKQFGDAAAAMAGLLPIVGPFAMTLVRNGNAAAAKIYKNRAKVVRSFTAMSGDAAQAQEALRLNAMEPVEAALGEAVKKPSVIAAASEGAAPAGPGLPSGVAAKGLGMLSSLPLPGPLGAATKGLGALSGFMKGGKRFSTRPRKIRKWKTRRNTFVRR
jgi:hypothetical protein